jgi:hypothetical protein
VVRIGVLGGVHVATVVHRSSACRNGGGRSHNQPHFNTHTLQGSYIPGSQPAPMYHALLCPV